jgi:arginase
MARLFKSITVIFSPYHVGTFNHRVGAGPFCLRQHGIIEAIKSLNINVTTKEIDPVDDFEGEIGKSFEILRRTANFVKEARSISSFPIVLAGNCMSTVGVAAGIGDVRQLGCIWFDAHDDYNTPSTMTSGYLDGTGVSMLSGESFHAMTSTIPGHKPLDLKQFVYCGLRDVNDIERKRVTESEMGIVWGDVNQKVDFTAELGIAITRQALGNVMVHLDLDVLDISLGRINEFAAPGGLFEDDLIGCLGQITTKTQPVSLTVASFNPHLGGEENISKIAIHAVKEFVKSLFRKDD